MLACERGQRKADGEANEIRPDLPHPFQVFLWQSSHSICMHMVDVGCTVERLWCNRVMQRGRSCKCSCPVDEAGMARFQVQRGSTSARGSHVTHLSPALRHNSLATLHASTRRVQYIP